MRRIMMTATAVILVAGALASDLNAQTSGGAASISTATQNFTPIVKAACGPHSGAHCGPFHHWVCGPRGLHCACVRC
jgi:hypothetical protein